MIVYGKLSCGSKEVYWDMWRTTSMQEARELVVKQYPDDFRNFYVHICPDCKNWVSEYYSEDYRNLSKYCHTCNIVIFDCDRTKLFPRWRYRPWRR